MYVYSFIQRPLSNTDDDNAKPVMAASASAQRYSYAPRLALLIQQPVGPIIAQALKPRHLNLNRLAV